MLVSGARENPKYPFQRRRARMMFKNRLTLAAKAAGGFPTRGPLEMLAGQLVVLLQIESQGQFQAHATTSPGRRIRMDRKAAMALVQKREPLIVFKPRCLGQPDRGQADEKPHLRLVRTIFQGQGTQDRQGFGIALAFDQRPRSTHARIGGQVSPPWRGRSLR